MIISLCIVKKILNCITSIAIAEKGVEKSNKNLKVIKNTLLNKLGNPESLKK